MSIITDGKGTTLAFGTSGLSVTKVRIKPPAVKSGGPIELTSLENTAWRTRAPKSLKDLDGVEFEGFYDPSTLLNSAVGTNEQITVTYPSGASHVFWGYLDEYEVGDIQEGERVMVTGRIVVTNRNGSGTETGPVYNAA